jgi:hypothetical protein
MLLLLKIFIYKGKKMLGTLIKPEPQLRAHITVEVDAELVAAIRDLKVKFKQRGERFSITSLVISSVTEAIANEENKIEETMF